MKSYVAVTGAVFAVVVGRHLVRLVVEGAQILRDPFYVISTCLAAALCGWAGALVLYPCGGGGRKHERHGPWCVKSSRS